VQRDQCRRAGRGRHVVTSSRILVVDDSLTIRRALELILKPLGYDLDFAADGAQALERATAFTPDLILLDYVLPDMRAPDVCAALAATPTTALTPIILVSAKGASIRQAYQDAQNVVSYITKPFKPQVVASVVQNALARARMGAASAGTTPSPAATRVAHPVRDALDATRARNGDAMAAAAPASMEQAFAALLAQLEGAMCEDRAATSAARHGAAFPGVSPRLRQAAARLDDISQHLHGDTVLPYRLRDDGSFANVATTLLEAHRALCEAAILLAATGAPSAALPRSPDVLIVCPANDEAAAEIASALRGAGRTPVLIGEEFAQLPHLVRLLAPRAVVGVPSRSAAADAALARTLALDSGATRFVAWIAPDGHADPRWTHRAHDVAALLDALRDVGAGTPIAAEATPDLDLEVVAV
jgi:CheY-like chemotaxis protein